MRPALWFAGLLLLASLLLVSLHLSANTLDSSRYNLGWNGTSRFFADLDRNGATEVTSLADLGTGPGALLVIVAPARPYRAEETAAYGRFLEEGNTILLADDSGTGNGLLRGLGSGIVIQEGPLLSYDREYNDPALVVATVVRNASVPGDPSRVILNRPGSVEGGEALLTSSFMSWIDRNGDGRIDSTEALGRHAVLAREGHGRGELLVLADPSIFINAMYGPGSPGDNARFITSLMSNSSPVLIDQVNSRTAADAGTSLAIHSLQRNPVAGFAVLAAGVLVLAAIRVGTRREEEHGD